MPTNSLHQSKTRGDIDQSAANVPVTAWGLQLLHPFLALVLFWSLGFGIVGVIRGLLFRVWGLGNTLKLTARLIRG